MKDHVAYYVVDGDFDLSHLFGADRPTLNYRQNADKKNEPHHLKQDPTPPKFAATEDSLRILAIARDLPRPLQHLVHLIEVKVAEQGRDGSLNAKDNFAVEERSRNYRRRRAPFHPDGWVGAGL